VIEVQKKKARKLNHDHEQAALRVLSINRIYCPKSPENFLEQPRKPRNIVLINSENFFGATEKSLKSLKNL